VRSKRKKRRDLAQGLRQGRGPRPPQGTLARVGEGGQPSDAPAGGFGNFAGGTDARTAPTDALADADVGDRPRERDQTIDALAGVFGDPVSGGRTGPAPSQWGSALRTL
jgi:hypothetical protein